VLILHSIDEDNEDGDDKMLKQKITDAIHSISDCEDFQENIVTCFDDTVSCAKSTFLLVIQTKFQKELLLKYGNRVCMMDAIYRTTKYGFPCFFLTVKTSLGIGRVVATIIPQNENEDMLTEGIQILKQWNPEWQPLYFMMDKSTVELNAVGNVFPSCFRLLCDFRRAQAWQRWVSKSANGVTSRDKDNMVLTYLKKLAYAITGKFVVSVK